MADPLTHLKQRFGDDWLIGCDSQAFFALTERVLAELRSRPSTERSLTILLAEREPLKFLASFAAACMGHCNIVLANPDWVEAEWQQVFELVVPDVVWGDRAVREWNTAETQRRRESPDPTSHTLHRSAERSRRSPTPYILIPTGGTSGNIRFAIHTWDTLMASVEGFCAYFEVEQVNSFCVLPLYHVSGLMQFLRSFTTGGKLVVMPFKSLEAGDRRSINPKDFFLSLVPTQLQRLLDQEGAEGQTAEKQRRGEAAFVQNAFPAPHTPYHTPHTRLPWLSRFHTVLLGGAPAWSDLLDRARSHRIRLAPTYGMTETASQIATLKPDDFLNGHTNAGYVLPHAQITICNPSGEILAPSQIGIITIQAKSLFYGYCPDLSDKRNRSSETFTPSSTNKLPPCQISCSGGLGELGPQRAGDRGEVPRTQSPREVEMLAHPNLQQREKGFQPDDLGFFDLNGYLHIIGRQTDKIITGGENVFPVEVEAAIRSTALVQDICVVGVSDRYWGQAIAAIYVPIQANTSTAAIQTALADKLTKFKHPKHWLAVDQLPRNAQGKVNRPQVNAIAKQALSTVPTID